MTGLKTLYMHAGIFVGQVPDWCQLCAKAYYLQQAVLDKEQAPLDDGCFLITMTPLTPHLPAVKCTGGCLDRVLP